MLNYRSDDGVRYLFLRLTANFIEYFAIKFSQMPQIFTDDIRVSAKSVRHTRRNDFCISRRCRFLSFHRWHGFSQI